MDSTKYALIVRYAVWQDRAHGSVRRRFGVTKCVVDRTLDLLRAAGPVKAHVFSLLRDGYEQTDWLINIDTVIVDPVLETDRAVGQVGDSGAGQAFGVVDDFLHVDLNIIGTEPLD